VPFRLFVIERVAKVESSSFTDLVIGNQLVGMLGIGDDVQYVSTLLVNEAVQFASNCRVKKK
jgi:hypothetical protein